MQGHLADAAVVEKRIESRVAHLHHLTTGPAWWVTAKIPYVGKPAQSARDATEIASQLTHQVLPQAVAARTLLRPTDLRVGADQINLAQITHAAELLVPAADNAAALLTRAQALPTDTWLGSVNDDRDHLVTEAAPLVDLLRDFAHLSQGLPKALGANGNRRYLVVFQTEAEARGLGGLPGSWAVLNADQGKLRFSKFGNDTNLVHISVHPPLGQHFNHEFKHLYHHRYRPTRSFLNSDPSPHFPDAAKIWMAMWEKRYGRRLDGAMTTDPGGLRELLKAVGSVKLHDGEVISDRNVVPFFEHTVYTKFAADEGTPRKLYLEQAAEAISKEVLDQPSSDLAATTQAARNAVNQRRLLIYSKNGRIERAIWNHPVSGVIPVTTQPYMGVVINNIRAGKVGYYLQRSVTYRRTTCAATTATVTFQVHNSAPSNLLRFVAGRYYGTPQSGATQLVISLYGTQGSIPGSVTVNGQQEVFRVKHERHHTVTITPPVFVPPGKTQTIVFHVQEPAATGPLITLRQPGVRQMPQQIDMPRCSS